MVEQYARKHKKKIAYLSIKEYKMTLVRKKGWKISLLRGILLVLFGIYALIESGQTVSTLMSVFGIFVLIFGVLLLSVLVAGNALGFNYPTVEAFMDIVIGTLIIMYPEDMAEIIIILIGAWILLIGIFILISGYQIRDVSPFWLVPFLSGILTILLAILLLANPFGAAKAAVIIIGLLAIISGLGLISNSISKTEIVIE